MNTRVRRKVRVSARTEPLPCRSLKDGRDVTFSDVTAGPAPPGKVFSEDSPSDRTRRFFAGFATLLLLLVVFAVFPREARAEGAQPFAPPSMTYGPGWERIVNPDGTVEIHQLPTFERWDGVWRPVSSLDQSTGEWPYSLSDTQVSFSVSRFNSTFDQAKIPGAVYEFQPEAIKETIAIRLVPITPVISISLTTTGLAVNVTNNTIVMNVPGGSAMWTAAGFRGWDSSPSPRMWPNAVSALTYFNGILNLTLDTDMIAHALYPLYVDPTWTLNQKFGWGASVFHDAVEDRGDHAIKIGWLADNFNDNVNEIWTIDAGSVTFTGGAMQIPASSSVHAGALWADQRRYDQKIALSLNFVTLGTVNVGFLMQDLTGRDAYVLMITGSTGYMELQQWIGGNKLTLGTFTTSITTGVTYQAKIVVQGSTISVYWQGLFATSGNGFPACSLSCGYIQIRTDFAAVIKADDVRMWNTSSGTITTAVRDAGASNRPLLERVGYTGGTFARVDSQILSSVDNLTWSDSHYVKVFPRTDLDYSIAEGDQNRYYEVKVTLRATDDGTSTPTLLVIATTEGTPASPAPSVALGYERWQYYVGGLVEVVRGNLFDSERDFGLPGKGFQIEFRRAYNSFKTYSGTLGLGWTHNYNVSLSGTIDITMYDGDGSTQIYQSLGSNMYSSPVGLSSSKLEKNGDGTYSLYWSDGTRWNFTAAGRLALIRDRNGNKLTLSYDGSNRLSRAQDDSGQYLEFLYDANSRITTVRDQTLRAWTYQYTSNRLTSVTDPLSNSTLYLYDASNRITKVVDRANRMTRIVYDGSSRVTDLYLGLYNRTTSSITWQYRWYTISGYANTRTRTVTDANNVASTFTLDERGTPKNVTGPLAGSSGACCGSPGLESVESQWDAERNKVISKDAKGNAWRFAYDYRGNELNRVDPTGNTTTATWDNQETGWYLPGWFISLPLTKTNSRGFTWVYAFYQQGNLMWVADPTGNRNCWCTYDLAGFRKTSLDFRGYQTNYTYDSHGWLTQVKNPLSFVTTYGYDSLGRLVNVTTPLGLRTQYVYDALDRQTKVTDPLGNSTSYVYNARGDLTKLIDPNAYPTQFQINVTVGGSSKTIQTGGNSTSFGYDTRGNLIAVTNPRLFTATHQFDAYSREINETTPGGNYTRSTYDRNGNVATRTDANGNLTTYTYDKLDRVTKVTYPGSVVVTAQYDANGNAVQMVGFGYTRTQTWDNIDRPTSTVDNYGSFAKTFGYQYDADSHRTRLNYSDGSFITYSYNKAAWITYENHSDGSRWSFSYDNDGRRASENNPNGAVTTTKYDKASRITNVWTNRSGSVLESFAYTYGKAGNQLSMTEANGSWARYSYDNLYRLLNESYSNGRSIGYTYDANGNRLTSREIKVGGSLVVTTFTYGKEDQLLKAVIAGGSTTTYTYDKNGNLKTRVSGAMTTTYVYDIENRLTSVTTSSSTISYAYSADGRRLKRVVASTTTYFGNDPVSPSGFDDTIEEYTSTGTKNATYVHGTGADELLGYKTTAWYSYHEDALGSVTRLTNSSGGTTSTYRYDAFGAIRGQTGSTNTYGFVSRESETAPGLYYNRARYYDPAGGRFISADPAGGGYAYAGDSPANFVDPSGMLSSPVHHGRCPIGGGCSSTSGGSTVVPGGCERGRFCRGDGSGGSSALGGVTGPEGVTGSGWSLQCTVAAAVLAIGLAMGVVGVTFGYSRVAEWAGTMTAGLIRGAAAGVGLSTGLFGIINIFVGGWRPSSIGSILSFIYTLFIQIILPSLSWWEGFGIIAQVAANLIPALALLRIPLLILTFSLGLINLKAMACF